MRFVVACFAFLCWIAPAQADQRLIENDCFGQIQGRIAWNYNGDRNWNPDNIYRLCHGTRYPSEPGRCFANVMHGGIDWGGGRRWQWENAIALCQGTNDADFTIGCFHDGMSRRMGWDQALSHCSGRHRPVSCQELVQGQIAWNYDGNRIWDEYYLNRLCGGSEYPAEPGRCYDQVMHGGINWGGSTIWEPDNVLNLCAGTNDASRTVGCFQDAIHRGFRWDSAIARCGR